MNSYDDFIITLASGYCASCKYWKGNRDLFYSQLEKDLIAMMNFIF